MCKFTIINENVLGFGRYKRRYLQKIFKINTKKIRLILNLSGRMIVKKVYCLFLQVDVGAGFLDKSNAI